MNPERHQNGGRVMYDPQLCARLTQYIDAARAGTLAVQIDYADLRALADLLTEAAGHIESSALERAARDVGNAADWDRAAAARFHAR